MSLSLTLITLGALFALGLLADEFGRRTRLPRVSLLILLGVIAGPAVLDVVPEQVHRWYEPATAIALTMVAFLLGGSLSLEQLRQHGRSIIVVSLSVVFVTLGVVGAGLIFLGVPVIVALLLSGIATATDPAATTDVIRQTSAKGRFSNTLSGIVAIDDAWGIIAFSLVLVLANILAANGLGITMQQGIWEIAGAVILGAVIGFPAALATGHLRPGEPMLSEALAVVFLCSGLAIWLEVSYLLAGVVAGMVVVNFARHHSRPFHEIEHVEWPFMILFFFLAGASLNLTWDTGTGIFLAVYVVLRIASRLAGGLIGSRLSGVPPAYGKWIGAALLPQAGVAIGMALAASDNFPALREIILPVVISSTVIFELLGPLVTRIALERTGQTAE